MCVCVDARTRLCVGIVVAVVSGSYDVVSVQPGSSNGVWGSCCRDTVQQQVASLRAVVAQMSDTLTRSESELAVCRDTVVASLKKVTSIEAENATLRADIANAHQNLAGSS